MPVPAFWAFLQPKHVELGLDEALHVLVEKGRQEVVFTSFTTMFAVEQDPPLGAGHRSRREHLIG